MANKGFTPGVHWAFMFRAVAFAKLGQLENAQDDVRELLKLFPQYPAFFWQLGYAWNYPTHRLENLAEALNRAGAGIPPKPELDS